MFFYTLTEAVTSGEVCDRDAVVRKYDKITAPDLNGTKVRRRRHEAFSKVRQRLQCLPACERDAWDVTRTTSFSCSWRENGESLFATIKIYYDALEVRPVLGWERTRVSTSGLTLTPIATPTPAPAYGLRS